MRIQKEGETPSLGLTYCPEFRKGPKMSLRERSGCEAEPKQTSLVIGIASPASCGLATASPDWFAIARKEKGFETAS
jgi:hypothetical protein